MLLFFTIPFSELFLWKWAFIKFYGGKGISFISLDWVLAYGINFPEGLSTLFFLLKLQPDCPPSIPSFLLWGPVLACAWNFSLSDFHQFFKVCLNYFVNNAFHDFVGVIRLPSFFHPSWHLCHLCRSFQILPWSFIIRVTLQ